MLFERRGWFMPCELPTRTAHACVCLGQDKSIVIVALLAREIYPLVIARGLSSFAWSGHDGTDLADCGLAGTVVYMCCCRYVLAAVCAVCEGFR